MSSFIIIIIIIIVIVIQLRVSFDILVVFRMELVIPILFFNYTLCLPVLLSKTYVFVSVKYTFRFVINNNTPSF